jgi:CRISPR-associated protein Cas2
MRRGLSGYRLMWMAVMFDLPVVTRDERKAATDFRLRLLDFGFEMAQFSVYMRFCVSSHQAETLAERVASELPKAGKVNIIFFTDKQYERILSFHGRSPQAGKKPPPQFELF